MARPSSLQPGTVFAGDYRVVHLLSEGGMGAVYVAEQLSTGKQRALKLMLPQLVADPRLRTRFEQEARIGSKVDSEHVVEVVAAGIDAMTGVPWLAMELLRGEDLTTYVKRYGALSPRAVLEIMEQLCHAVGTAHAAGVVHRDLKPENIFVAQARRTGSSFMIKVLDFGIAKVVAEAKTAETAALGSPMWMAPEQTMRGAEVGPPTDVWALALIAFYLLTGRYFWRSAEDETASITHVLREIAVDPIPPLAQRAAEVGASFPPGFDRWFSRGVDRNVHARFPNASVQFAELTAVFAPYVGGYTPTPAPAAQRTQPQAPIYAASTTGAMGVSGPAGGGGITVWPFVLGALLIALVGGGIAVYATVGRDWMKKDDPAQATATTTTATTTASAPIVAAVDTALNHWIAVASATKSVKLGVADERSSDPGFRPSRNIEAPRASYEIQQHEVTWEEMEPYLTEHPDLAFAKPSWVPLAHDKLPATNVPWSTAHAYCKSIHAMLPTEEQWEFAARGSELRPHPWGSEPLDLARTPAYAGEKANTLLLKTAMLSDQDQTPGEDPVQINDMAGNALEWTIDLYREDRPGQNEHWVEEGGLTYRAVRGVPIAAAPPRSFPASTAAYRQSLCATGPCPADTGKVLQYVGFRCVKRAKS